MSTIGARAADNGGHAVRDRGRTAAQWYCYIVGPILLLVDVFGFISDAHFDTGTSGLQGDGFLGFEVNAWHNLVHIASGLFLLALAAKRTTAKTATLAFGAIYAVVTVIGLIDGNDILGLFPINPADNVLHALLAASAIAVGLVSPADDRVESRERSELKAAPRPERTREPARS
jgi:Domain of unknown function (DUF4383)